MIAENAPFWRRKTLEQLSPQEWESLCDGCGLCCLQKLEDEDDNSVYYTRIACKLLDLDTCQCSDYPNRFAQVPDCIQLTPGKADQFKWLPSTCGYRLVSEGKDLPAWHHRSAAIVSRSMNSAFPSRGACSVSMMCTKTTGKTT